MVNPMGFSRIFRQEIRLWYEIVLVVLGGVLASILGLVIGGLVLPILQLLAIVYVFLLEVYKRRLWRASGLVLLWSIVLTVVVAGYTCYHGCTDDIGYKIIRGREYLDEMITWLTTGKGPEGDPRLFLVPKIIELALFTAVSFATVGVGGLLMGAILLNYMNYYYGTLIWMARGNPVAIVMGWPIYAIIRVVGYVFLGTVLTRLAMSIIQEKTVKVEIDPVIKKMAAIAVVLIVADFILKGTVANTIYYPVLSSILSEDRLSECIALIK